MAFRHGNISRNGSNPAIPAILGPDGHPMRNDLRSTGPEAGAAIPHVIQFAGMVGSGWKAYLHDRWDEAMRHSREDALVMRNDCFLQSLMQERALATASLKWHLEADNDRDPQQKAVVDGMTSILRATPKLQQMLYYLVDETVWVGRGGAQVVKKWKNLDLPRVPRRSFGTGMAGGASGTQPQQPDMSAQQQQPADPNADPSRSQAEKRRALCLTWHQPVSGDSIGHKWDGTPYCLVHAAEGHSLPNVEIINATVGRAVVLKGTWRPRFILHSHLPMAANFFDVEKAEAIHGVGVRSVIFWWNNLRLEFISNVADWCERTGLGVRVWYFQGGNTKSEDEVARAASQQRDKVNILVPRFGDKGHEGVEFVDTATAGADLLLRLQEHIEAHIERYIIGQSMSSGQGQGDSLGGEGKSKLAADTKGRIISFDATNLAETLTEDWVKPTLAWSYPDFADLPVRFVMETDEQDPQKFMSGVKMYLDMGGQVRDAEVRGKLGVGEVMPGDKTLSSQQGGGAPGGMPGMPGAPPPAQPGAAPGQEAQAPDAGGEEPDAAALAALARAQQGEATPAQPT